MPSEPGLSDEPFVDVIVPVHDEEAYIAEKIENLRALDYPTDKIQFWIVDGASRDATPRAATAAAAGDPRFTLLRADAADKARQMTLALSMCRGDWILVTDADSRLAADTLRNLVKEGVSAPSTGAVGVAVTPARPHPWEELHWRTSDGIRLREAACGSASIVTGPCYLVRRGIVDRFPPGVVADDVYVAFRTAASGLRTGFIPGNVTELRTPASIRELIPHKFRKARAYVREIFRFLPRLGTMRRDSRRTFLHHAAKMLLFPLAVIPAAALAVRAAGAPVSLSAALAAASAVAAKPEWRRRAALGVLLTAVLFVATVSLLFVGPRLPYRKVDARRLPLAEIDAA
jgi:cellulose synthase/poly-beta-1,6-N-acetylglucosamine synthase-like glycosyltransferase